VAGHGNFEHGGALYLSSGSNSRGSTGDVQIVTNSSTNRHSSGNIYIATGHETFGNSNGGSIHLQTHSAGDILLDIQPSKSKGGNIFLSGGDSKTITETAVGGNLYFEAGNSESGNGGSAFIKAGMSDVLDGGDISLVAGIGAKGHHGGNINLLAGRSKQESHHYPIWGTGSKHLGEEIKFGFSSSSDNEDVPLRVQKLDSGSRVISNSPIQVTTIQYSSDIRIKTNIQSIDTDNLLEKLQLINICEYGFSSDWRRG
jgi:hypothetical protein